MGVWLSMVAVQMIPVGIAVTINGNQTDHDAAAFQMVLQRKNHHQEQL